jgi:spore germination cell wall hydrolase CwlJ-like protein
MAKRLIIPLSLLLITTPVAKELEINTEVNCLAKAIYFEARGEPKEGMVEVANVVLNRVKSGKFPSSICGVVYQPKQFSWTNNEPLILNEQKFYLASRIAIQTIKTHERSNIYWFSASTNGWHDLHLKMVKRIGNHKFYRK